MLRAAFCDDDLNVLKEMDILFEKYCAARTQKIVYAMFRSPLEVLAEIEDRKSTRLNSSHRN